MYLYIYIYVYIKIESPFLNPKQRIALGGKGKAGAFGRGSALVFSTQKGVQGSERLPREMEATDDDESVVDDE